MKRPRCYNRKPYADASLVQDGWIIVEDNGIVTRLPNMITIPFKMSKGCPQHGEHGLARIEKWNCSGCRWHPKETALE